MTQLCNTPTVNKTYDYSTAMVEELIIKQKLIGELLSAKTENRGLLQFKEILNDHFMKFANSEDAVANEAEMLLKLQDIEKELELVSANTALHKKTFLAIGGGFSAGKSEFISSFINDTIKLPVGINPTTAIPTYVIHEEKRKYTGCTLNGANIDLFSIDENIQTKFTHDFIKSFGFNLKEIMPFMVLGTKTPYRHLCFVDTPGYNPATVQGGFTDEDFHTANNFLNHADTLLWLVGADTNGTIPASDLEFLSDLDLEKKKLYVVLSKADLKSPGSIEDILDEIEECLDEYDIETEGICAYSATKKKEYAYRNKSLSQFLEEQNREATKIDDVVKKLFTVYETYKKALLKKKKEKKAIKNLLKSLELDFMEDGNDISQYQYLIDQLDILDKFFTNNSEKKHLQELDVIFLEFKKSIEVVFLQKSHLNLPEIDIQDIEIAPDLSTKQVRKNKKKTAFTDDLNLLFKPVTALDLNKKTEKILIKRGIRYIGEILLGGEKQLSDIDKIGSEQITTIKNRLKKYNLTLETQILSKTKKEFLSILLK